MTKPPSTKEKLLQAAKDLFWTRGYSNVSVRDITGLAGVDAALVSRYFGGKQGLFEATLADIKPWEALDADKEHLLDALVASFCHPYNPETDQANPFAMLLANMNDAEMGDKIRNLVQEKMADKLAKRLAEKAGSAPGHEHQVQAAMVLASLTGMAMMRKYFQLNVFDELTMDELTAQNHHLTKAAFDFKS